MFAMNLQKENSIRPKMGTEIEKGIRVLSPMKARIARHAKIDAIKACDYMVDALENGRLKELTDKYMGITSERQQKLLADNYRQISSFLKNFDDRGFLHDNTLPGVFAYVFPGHMQHIFLCDLFFNPNVPLYGRDSKVGTLIHEVSHLVLGTKDYGYGQMLVEAFARLDDKRFARGNADNVEALAEVGY